MDVDIYNYNSFFALVGDTFDKFMHGMVHLRWGGTFATQTDTDFGWFWREVENLYIFNILTNAYDRHSPHIYRFHGSFAPEVYGM